jgi:integrase
MTTEFKVPNSPDEVLQLQRDTTQLLHDQRVKVALNKLCPRHRSDDEARTAEKRRELRAGFNSDKELIAAAGRPAPVTAARYRVRAKGVFADAQQMQCSVWKLVEERSRNVDSWYTFKAGMRFFLMEKVGQAKKVIDEWRAARRAGTPAPFPKSTFDYAIRLLPALATALAATPDGAPPEKYKSGGSRPGVNSKAASIKGRPDDWREQVAATMEGSTKLLFLMQCVTGCRPAELKRGMSVMLAEHGELEFSVAGAKVGKYAGQPLREGGIEAKNGVAGELAKMLKVGLRVDSAPLMDVVNTYCRLVARRAEKVFPTKKANRRLSAYSSRHQLRADLRGSGVSREKTAQMMGHTTTKSATYYGTGGRAGRGAVKLSQVSATRPVKQRATYPGQTRQAKATTASAGAPETVRKPKPRG